MVDVHRRSGRASEDRGFTLVEVLMAVAVMALIIGAIGAGIITVLNNQAASSNRLSDSANANLTSAIYVRDVQSAAMVTTTQSPLHTPVPCGVGGANMLFELGLTWSTPTAGVMVVSYYNDTNANSLVRQYCAPSGPVVCSPGTICLQSTVTVTRGLCPQPPIAPVTLPPNCPVSSSVQVAIAPPSDSTAAGTDWTSVVGMSSVTLSAKESASSFRFDLLASPRLSSPQSLGVSPGGNPQPPPLFLLGQSAPVLSCAGSSSSHINVNGAAFLDSTANGAGQISGNSSFTATQIYTADPNPSGAITGNYSPSPPTYLNQQADPFAGLVPPDTVGSPAYTNSPVYSDGAYHGPGVYTTTLSFSGQSSTTLATGTYVLRNGISVTGGATVSSAAGGVLLYVSGGTIMFAGNGAVTVTPLTPGPFAPTAPNLGIWQAASDTNTILLSGNGSGNTFAGTIYAPTALVGSAGNGNFTVGSIVASSLTCAGNGTETIG